KDHDLLHTPKQALADRGSSERHSWRHSLCRSSRRRDRCGCLPKRRHRVATATHPVTHRLSHGSGTAWLSRLSTTSHTSARKDIWRAVRGVTTVARMTALLLAEPEATMRGFLERQLRSDGFDVLAFPSTDELPRSADPDVLVL